MTVAAKKPRAKTGFAGANKASLTNGRRRKRSIQMKIEHAAAMQLRAIAL
jgi:hypothetical protein